MATRRKAPSKDDLKSKTDWVTEHTEYVYPSELLKAAHYETSKDSYEDRANKTLAEIVGRALSVETDERQAADSALLVGIANEERDRKAADNALQEQIDANKANIETNRQNIAQNAADIAQNAADIAQNAADIAANKQAIADEAKAREEADSGLQKQIDTNAGEIAENAADIQKNATDIATANEAIQKNADDITAANEAIQKNAANITTANEAIQKNAGDIASANEAISANSSKITETNETIDNLSATVNQNTEAISAEEAARITADNELADKIAAAGTGSATEFADVYFTKGSAKTTDGTHSDSAVLLDYPVVSPPYKATPPSSGFYNLNTLRFNLSDSLISTYSYSIASTGTAAVSDTITLDKTRTAYIVSDNFIIIKDDYTLPRGSYIGSKFSGTMTPESVDLTNYVLDNAAAVCIQGTPGSKVSSGGWTFTIALSSDGTKNAAMAPVTIENNTAAAPLSVYFSATQDSSTSGAISSDFVDSASFSFVWLIFGTGTFSGT